MYFSGQYVLSNGENMDDFSMISIFGVILLSKFGYLTPEVPIYRVPPNCYAIHIEDIESKFTPNVFLWSFCVI